MVASLAGFASGCKKEEVQVYQAPKDLPPAAPSGSASSAADSGMPAAGAGAGAGSRARASAESGAERPPWQVPEGWTEKPREGQSMRIASYGVTAADGRTIDISVVPLGPVAGSELDNVNRWRNQIGLPPISQAELDSQTAAVAIGGMTGKMYDMVGTQPTLDGKYKARILAAVLNAGGTTVFFKMIGEDALVSENKPKFLAWLKSVDIGDSSGGSSASSSASAPASAPAAPVAPPPASMAGPVTPPPATGLPEWEVPEGWKSVPASTMRLASFAVGNGGDFSVVALGPAAGGTLANLNRWRGQLGLAPIAEAEVAAATSSVPLKDGQTAILADLTGEGQFAGRKMLAAIVPRPDRTWFFKLTGDAALVTAERERFVKFLKSVKY